VAKGKFKRAIQACPATRGGYCDGLQAIHASHRDKFTCRKPRALTGSIDLDASLRAALPNDPRWDYGIGYAPEGREKVAWIEVHPASSDHVSEVIAKYEWLRSWLSRNIHELSPPSAVLWVASGRITLLRNGQAARRLARSGLDYPCASADLDDLCS
jgi:hypothetical protein